MIRSMSGFGTSEREVALGRLVAEVKTVNHRYLNLNVRLPRALERHEAVVREALKPHLGRGHINVTVRLEREEDAPPGIRLKLDEGKAREYLRVFRALQERLEIPGEVDLSMFSRFNDLIIPDEEEREEIPPEWLAQVVSAAAAQAAAMREEEGRSLERDLDERLDAIEAALVVVREQAPERLAAERDRLRERVAELAGGVQVDEGRLAQEIAYLAERIDIGEELVRLESHIRLFRETLAAEAAGPVGKRLGFLVQEMHRETNTIGSKSNDARIDAQVIEIKNEVERMREQVENVE